MQYILEYSICALFFLGVIMVHFFATKQFPNKQNRLFGLMLAVGLFDISMDIASSVVITYARELSIQVVNIICTAFYVPQLAFAALMLLYILIITDNYRREYRWQILALMAPVIVFELLLFINPLTRWIFYVDPAAGYTRGPLFVYQFVCAFFYVLLSAGAVQRYRKRLPPVYYGTIMGIIVIILSSVLIQYFKPNLLLTSPAIAICITMMYLVMQKPGDMVDVKTGAFNAAAMRFFLMDSIRDRKEYHILVIMVSNLRSVNWACGLAAGDAVLAQACAYLSGQAGETGWVFRMGGSKFAVITRKREQHRRLLHDIRERFSAPWNNGSGEILLSADFCNLENTAAFHSADEIIGILNTVEQELRHGTRMDLDRDVTEVMRRYNEVESALIEGLEKDDFELFFQPLYDVKNGGFPTAEALLRFFCNGENISPAEFIPIAERNDLILRIDALVLRKVCAFLRDSLPPEQGGLAAVEVNLSAAEFLYDDLPERICTIVDSYGIDPGRILFEITETAATAGFEALRGIMAELGARGFRFVLDDFGSGYANIEQVAQLPFYAAKMDRTMLLASGSSQRGEIIYRHNLQMFQELGLVTVAEGVETEAETRFLRSLDVDYIQGYYYSRPLNSSRMAEFLHDAKQTL